MCKLVTVTLCCKLGCVAFDCDFLGDVSVTVTLWVSWDVSVTVTLWVSWDVSVTVTVWVSWDVSVTVTLCVSWDVSVTDFVGKLGGCVAFDRDCG